MGNFVWYDKSKKGIIVNWKKIVTSVHFQIFVVVIGLGFIYSRYAISVSDGTDNPMIRAASTGDSYEIQKLLKKGMSPNVVDESIDGPIAKSGPLALAVWNGNFPQCRKAADFLLTHQANVRMRDLAQQCPIHKIVRIDFQDARMEMLSKLIKFGADIEAKDNRQCTFLDLVVELNDTIFVGMILDVWGKILTPAIMESAKETTEEHDQRDVAVVLAKGPRQIVVNPNWQPATIDKRTGLNDLHFAVIKNDQPLVKAIIEKRVSPNVPSEDSYGLRPLHYAVLQQCPEMVTLLVEKNGNVNGADLLGNTPLHYVAFLSDKKIAGDIADYLLKKGANINAVNNEGNTLLHMLIYANDAQLIDVIGKKYQFNRAVKNGDRESASDLADRLNRKELLKNIK